MQRYSALIAIAALAALPLFASAQQQPLDKLSDKYADFAGSDGNAKSLVQGLRAGDKVTLTSTDSSGKTTTTTFQPATGKMGVGNVNIALSLAEASLKQQGITNPTPEQIQAALNGGTVKLASGQTVTLQGVLAMRADGKGWGVIAHELGFKLGDVMRHDKVARAERPERAAKVDKIERPERPDRPMKPERPEKPERPGR